MLRREYYVTFFSILNIILKISFSLLEESTHLQALLLCGFLISALIKNVVNFAYV